MVMNKGHRRLRIGGVSDGPILHILGGSWFSFHDGESCIQAPAHENVSCETKHRQSKGKMRNGRKNIYQWPYRLVDKNQIGNTLNASTELYCL